MTRHLAVPISERDRSDPEEACVSGTIACSELLDVVWQTSSKHLSRTLDDPFVEGVVSKSRERPKVRLTTAYCEHFSVGYQSIRPNTPTEVVQVIRCKAQLVTPQLVAPSSQMPALTISSEFTIL